MNRLDALHKEAAAKLARRKKRTQFSPTSGESSTNSGEESEVGPQCVLTAAALQEMDEANTKDWKQAKNRRLTGVRGHLHAAKRMLDAERQQRQTQSAKLAKKTNTMQCTSGQSVCPRST